MVLVIVGLVRARSNGGYNYSEIINGTSGVDNGGCHYSEVGSVLDVHNGCVRYGGAERCC